MCSAGQPLAELQRRGLASFHDEGPHGLSSLAASLTGRAARVVAAIEVSGPRAELDCAGKIALRRTTYDASATLRRNDATGLPGRT
jgi:DNA-binding IclR family transcriptional regulator